MAPFRQTPLPAIYPWSAAPELRSPSLHFKSKPGGNAITKHHDASTIFYFKLLYVLVPLILSPSRFASVLVAPATSYRRGPYISRRLLVSLARALLLSPLLRQEVACYNQVILLNNLIVARRRLLRNCAEASPLWPHDDSQRR